MRYKMPPVKEERCLVMINNERKQIAEKLNSYCVKTIELKEGNEQIARKHFDNMLAMVDVATMLDILSNEEHEKCYEDIHCFFSGVQIQQFNFPELHEHHFADKGILDLIMIYKINMQEKMNEILKMYRETSNVHQIDKNGYINACESILSFAKEFSLLKDEEINDARTIINEHRKNKIKKEKIIYIPEHFYTLEN